MKKLPIIVIGDPATSFANQDFKEYLDKKTIDIHYVDAVQVEIDALEKPDEDIPKVLNKIEELAALGAPCVLLYGVGHARIIKIANQQSSIPVYNFTGLILGAAQAITKSHFTIIPVMKQFSSYLDEQVNNAGFSKNYLACDNAVDMPLWQFRGNKQAYEKTKQIVFAQIERGIDTITFGCSGFAGMLPALSRDIDHQFKKNIQLIDHMKTPVDILLRVFFNTAIEYEKSQ